MGSKGVLGSTALDQLNNAEGKALLDTIDDLRELRVGDIVQLPQIIVVGDQSAGKSSVLEAISRVKFPIKGDLCTRFPTELVLRRTPEPSINVKIKFAADGLSKSTKGVPEPFQRTSLDLDELPDIIEQAKEHMGLRDGSQNDFSEDILRIEVASPDVYPLTLVDLPGFFHATTSDQSKNGKAIVKQLVKRYMQQKNSIMLVVVSANAQLASHKVLQEAMNYDPQRERTLGVITKPDLPEPGSSDERRYIQLAKGEEPLHNLPLGWHVLRNSSESEGAMEASKRDAKEESFFQSGAWSSISKKHRGVESLRKKLSKVLLEHVQKSLPGLVQEIESKLNSKRSELERCGKPRNSPEDIRSYLVDIAEEYQLLARDGIHGRYSNPFFGSLYQTERKLRAVLRNLNHAFDLIITQKGSSYDIDWEDRDDGVKASKETPYIPEYLHPFVALYEFQQPESISEGRLRAKLEKLASANRGQEFPGSPNHNLVMEFFKLHAKPWHEIAAFHLKLAGDICKAFVERVFTHVFGSDKMTLTSVLRVCVDSFFEEHTTLMKNKLDELLRPYTAGYGPPLASEFQQKLSKRTLSRLAGQIEELLGDIDMPQPTETKTHGTGEKKKKPAMTYNMILSTMMATGVFEKSPFNTDNVIDMAIAHYEMSRRTFTENIINLGLENCLVSHLPSILTSRMIYAMKDDDLKDLAGESEDIIAERHELQQQVKVLSDGLRKCQKYQPRQMTAIPLKLAALHSVLQSQDPTMNQGNNVPSFRSYIVPKQLQFNANASTSAQSQVLGGFSGVSTGPRQTPTAAPAPVQKSIFGTTFAATSTPVYGNIFDKPSNPVPAQSSTISNASIFAPSSPFNKPSTATPTTLSGLLFANNTTPTSGGLFSKGSDSTPSSLGSDISITKYVQEDDAFPHVSKKPKSAAREKI